MHRLVSNCACQVSQVGFSPVRFCTTRIHTIILIGNVSSRPIIGGNLIIDSNKYPIKLEKINIRNKMIVSVRLLWISFAASFSASFPAYLLVTNKGIA